MLMIKTTTPIVPLLVRGEQWWNVVATIVNIVNTTTHLSSSLGTPFYVTSSLSSPSLILSLHTKNPASLLPLFLTFLSLFSISSSFSSFAMFSESKLTIFFPCYISRYNCHPSSSLVSISIYFTASPNFYSSLLISCYKRFPSLSLSRPLFHIWKKPRKLQRSET